MLCNEQTVESFHPLPRWSKAAAAQQLGEQARVKISKPVLDGRGKMIRILLGPELPVAASQLPTTAVLEAGLLLFLQVLTVYRYVMYLRLKHNRLLKVQWSLLWTTKGTMMKSSSFYKEASQGASRDSRFRPTFYMSTRLPPDSF